LALLTRTGKSVRLTAAGKIFFGEARDILAHVAGAMEKVRTSIASQAEINVGYLPSGTVGMLSPALDMQELARYETCVAVGATHPLAKAKFVSLEQVASEPVATYARKDYPGYYKHLEKMFATVGRQPRIGSEHDSGSSLIAAVAAGQEFALLPSSVRSAAGARLKFLKLRPALPPWLIVALWRKDAETEPVRAFVAAATSKPGRKRRDGSPKFNQQTRNAAASRSRQLPGDDLTCKGVWEWSSPPVQGLIPLPRCAATAMQALSLVSSTSQERSALRQALIPDIDRPRYFQPF